MNLAYLCADFGVPIHGAKGAAVHVRELSRALAALGHRVEIFAPRAGGSPPPGFPVPVHEFPLDPTETALHDLLRADPAAGPAVAREVRAALYATALRHRAGPPLRALRPDALYERYALWSTAGLALALALGVPLILEVNAPLTREQAAHRGLAFAQTARAVERTVLRAADRVVAVSDGLRDWLIESGVEPHRIVVLPNAVDPDRFAADPRAAAAARAELGIPPECPVVGFVGTLKAWHGTATLVRAVAALHARPAGPSPLLLIVGDGPERPALEDLARREGIAAATTFTGAVPHDRVPAYLAALDVAAAPYDADADVYFSPLKVFEYLAAGRPVVAAAAGQLAALLRHGETALLYPPGDPAALADAVAALLADPARAAALGRAGQAHVRNGHTWAGNAAAVAALVEELQAERAGAPPAALAGVG